MPALKTFDVDKSIYLIDASAYVFRAYYALQPLSSKGRPSHAVAGFASMLLKLLKERKPKGCVVVFDSKKPTFRKDIFPLYKANREAPPPDLSGQITAVREMCEKAGLGILQSEGFEADDWIASFVKQFESKECIAIVSSDKDLMQLVTPCVKLYDSFRDRWIGEAEVEEKWGVPPRQVRDLLALTGDSSDNIPGLKGVGPKTAAAALKIMGSIDEFPRHKAKLPEKIRLNIEEHPDELRLSRELVSLKDDLSLPFKEVPSFRFPMPKAFADFLRDWDCQRVIQNYQAELAGDSPSSSSRKSESLSVDLKEKSVTFKLAQSISDLDQILNSAEKSKLVSFDVETSSFNKIEAQLVGVSIATNKSEAWYVPYRHPPSTLSEKEVRPFLEKILGNPQIKKVAHNLKYDSEICRKEGIKLAGELFDTMIEGHLSHADRRSFSLDSLAQDFIGESKGDLKALLNDSQNFATVNLDDAKNYAAQDSSLTLQLHELFSKELAQQPQSQWLYREVELPLAQILGRVESTGILLDSAYLNVLSQDFHARMEVLKNEIYQLAGSEFNISSPKQLQDVLFTRLKLKPSKKTKTGFSTDESVLIELSESHALPKLILDHRSLSKLTSTYVDVLPTLVSPITGRLHTSYHQTGTATGRLSSSEPNLQNIPIRSEEGVKIRKAFIAERGFKLLSIDYSQVELRLFAHLSDEKNMIEAFRSGRDIHSETAKLIFGSDAKEERSRAKAINFGIIYGSSAFGLAKTIGSSRGEAQKFIDAYFNTFPRFKAYMEELVVSARTLGYTETLFGRRRPLPDINSKNPTLRQMAERIAINAPVQGTAADIMKSAMVRIFQRMKEESLKSRLLLQVHDELVLEVLESEIGHVTSLVTEEMKDLSKTPVKKLKVELAVDSGVGSDWASIG